MNTYPFTALALAVAVGAFAGTPVHAQDSMAAASSTAMAHQSMQAQHVMKGAMHHDAMKMKQGAMQPRAMQHKAMKPDAMQMKKDAAMKMKHAAGTAMDSGG